MRHRRGLVPVRATAASPTGMARNFGDRFAASSAIKIAHIRIRANVTAEQNRIAIPIGQQAIAVEFDIKAAQVDPSWCTGLHDQDRLAAGAFQHGRIFAARVGVGIAEEGVGVPADHDIDAADALSDLQSPRP